MTTVAETQRPIVRRPQPDRPGVPPLPGQGVAVHVRDDPHQRLPAAAAVHGHDGRSSSPARRRRPARPSTRRRRRRARTRARSTRSTTVPIDGDDRAPDAGRARAASQSTFVDPNDPTATPIVWEGRWRTLSRPGRSHPRSTNFTTAWTS